MENYVPLISGLIGALIGAAASITTVLVQSKLQAKRDRTKNAIDLALHDWKHRLDIAKERGGPAYPLAVFIHYHSKIIELAENGALTADAIKKLSFEQDEIVEAVHEVNARWKSELKNKNQSSKTDN